MDCAIGTWDFDTGTDLLTVGPDGGLPQEVRFPKGGLPLAELSCLIHPEDASGLERAVRDWIGGGVPAFRHRFRVGAAESGWLWIEATGRKGPDDRSVSGVWVDVTEQESESARKIEAVSRIHQFAAAASHDLIGPLRHIAMYGDLLVEDFGTGATQEKRRMLEAIADKARTLQVLTKRLIAFSTGTAAPEFVAVPLDRTLVRLRGRIDEEIGQAGATLHVGPLPVVLGDPVLIEKVLESLLRNALEWRGDGALEIWIESESDGRSTVIIVSDNGTGIDERYVGRIFDAFWSLPRPGGEKGAGLGLAVCKTILDALGGDVRLRSTSPEGSVFEVVLPLWR